MTSIGTHPSGVGQHGELKWRVRALSTDFPSVSTSNSYRNLAVIGAGTEYYQRVGRRAFIHNVRLQGALVQGATNSVADDPYNTFKLALVLAAPSFAPTTDWAVTTPMGPQQVPGVIKVLWTCTYVVTAKAKDSTGYIPGVQLISEDIPVNTEFQWSSAADVAASNTGLFLVAVSDSTAVPHPGFVNGYSEIIFSDS